MQRNAPLSLRLWRLGPWNANPLMRGSDRCQAVIRLLLVALALLAVPIAGAAGTAAYAGSAERLEAGDAVKTVVTATVTAEPDPKGPFARFAPPRYEAPVRWERDGRAETATIAVDRTDTVGSEVRVWLDGNGRVTTPALGPSGAVWDGIGTALSIVLATWAAVAGLYWLTGRMLAHRRGMRWDAELRGLGRAIET